MRMNNLNNNTTMMVVSSSVYSYNAFIFTIGFALPLSIIIATSYGILRFVKQVIQTWNCHYPSSLPHLTASYTLRKQVRL
jgi:hypothetical protein